MGLLESAAELVFGQKSPLEGPWHAVQHTAYGEERHVQLDRHHHPVANVMNALMGGAVDRVDADVEWAPVGPEIPGRGREYSGCLAVAQYRDRDGKAAPIAWSPSPDVAWAEDPIGSLCWCHAAKGTMNVAWLFVEAADEAAHRRATAGAMKELAAWLDKHGFTPREYRPKKFSEGFVVLPEPQLWCAHPRSGSNPLGLRGSRTLFNPKTLEGRQDARQ